MAENSTNENCSWTLGECVLTGSDAGVHQSDNSTPGTLKSVRENCSWTLGGAVRTGSLAGCHQSATSISAAMPSRLIVPAAQSPLIPLLQAGGFSA